MIKLTDLEGQPFWVFKAWVQVVRRTLDHENYENAGAVVVMSGENIAVRETPGEIVGLLTGIPQ